MAGKPAIQVSGAREFQRAVRRMATDLDDPATPEAAARPVLERALAFAPVRSGALAGSGRVERTDDGAEVLFGSPLVPYAGVIEHGWPERGIEGQHYLERAAGQAQGAVHNVYADQVEGLVRRVGRDS